MSTSLTPALFYLDAAMINWKLLRKQKLWLIANHEVEHGDKKAFEATEGLLNFIDSIQDSAVDQGLVSEKEVFGFSSHPTDAQLLAAHRVEQEVQS